MRPVDCERFKVSPRGRTSWWTPLKAPQVEQKSCRRCSLESSLAVVQDRLCFYCITPFPNSNNNNNKCLLPLQDRNAVHFFPDLGLSDLELEVLHMGKLNMLCQNLTKERREFIIRRRRTLRNRLVFSTSQLRY